jgi:hypothetical protein
MNLCVSVQALSDSTGFDRSASFRFSDFEPVGCQRIVPDYWSM